MDCQRRKALARRLYRNKVREYRLDRELTQSELARRTHLSQPMISAIENDRIFLSSFDALTIAGELQCALDDLFEKR